MESSIFALSKQAYMAKHSSPSAHLFTLLWICLTAMNAGAAPLDSLPLPPLCADRRWSDAEAAALLVAAPDSMRQDTALVLQRLAVAVLDLKYWDCATALMEASRRAWILKKDYDAAAGVQLQLASWLIQKQKVSEAIDELRSALQWPAMSARTNGQIHQALMEAWLQRDSDGNALIHGRLAAQFFQVCGADCHSMAAEVLMANAFVQTGKGNLPDARKLLEEARLLLRRTGTEERSHAWMKLHLLSGDLYAAWGENEEALRRYHRALMAVLPTLTNKDYRIQPDTILPHQEPALAKILAGKAATFRALYLKTKRIEHLTRAAACFRLSRQAEALFQASSEALFHPFFRMDTGMRNQQAIETALELAKLQPSVASTESAFAAAEHEKEQLLKKYIPTRMASSVSLADIQQTLPGNDIALIEYVAGAERLFVFVVTKTRYEAISLPLDFPAGIWMAKMRKDMEAFQNPDAARESLCRSYSSQAFNLYEKLIRPIEKAVSLPLRLIIIPSAELSWIPFEALLTEPAPAGCNCKNYPYLLRRYSISYGISSALQQEVMRRPHVQGGYLGLAPYWPEMPESENRLDWMQQMAQQLHGKALLRDEANHKALTRRSLRKSILHIGAPAQTLLPVAAFVLLSDGHGGQDTLHAADIQALPLEADLLVLDRHFTNTITADAIAWQAGSWLHTGARSVLMPVWTPVGDAPAKVQELFFENLQQAQPKDVALQNAKLQYLQQADSITAHPAYWAAWALVGDAGTQIQEPGILMKYGMGLLLALVLAGAAVWWRVRRQRHP